MLRVDFSSILGGGTTWYGAGLLGAVKSTPTETAICQDSIRLYQELTAQGHDLGWKQCGSLSLARTKNRMMYLKRLAATANSQNIPCKLLTPAELENYCSQLHLDDLEVGGVVQGGLWVEADGVGDQLSTCLVLAAEAHRHGVAIIENCSVEQVLTDARSGVSQVMTSRGPVNCEYFVNCSGYSSRNVGRLSNPQVNVPVYPCEQYYLHTMPVDDMDPDMPVIYDHDGHIYIREYQGRYLAGGYEPISKPVDPEQLPKNTQPIPEDWDQFYILLQQILHRIPSMEEVQVDRLWCRPKGFTPDCKWIIGQAPEVERYFVAAGLMSKGLECAGGVGKLTADWIVNGEVDMDVLNLDIRRFLSQHNNHLFLRDRIREAPGFHYNFHYPFSEFSTGRCLRMSPLYPRLYAKGAYFGQVMGYERPCYFGSQVSGSSNSGYSVT
ncbi:PDPR, partial [Cordylochernes scorpioides]